MNRRRFLVGAGGICVGLPMLRRFAGSKEARAAGSETVPTRVISMAYPMGTHLPQWTPSATGTDFTLPAITAPLTPFIDRCAFVSNCPNAVLQLGGEGYVWGHPAKQESVFTGTLMRHAFSGDGSNHVNNVNASSPNDHIRTPNGPSVEHLIGQALATGQHHRPSVDLGVWGRGGTQTTEDSNFFYEAASNPVTLNAHPGLAFAELFNGINPDDGEVDEAFLALQRRKKSVLDAVRDSFVDLRQGLVPADRAVLDDHADKIRQIELDMPPLAACMIPDGFPPDDDPYAGMSMMELGDLVNRLMAHAMGCGVAPVGRIEYLDQQLPWFGIPEVDDAVATVQDWHHPIVHASDGWTKDDPVRVTGFTFFTQKFADLLGYLDDVVEGLDGETLLDNSLMVLGSDLGEGEGHGATDLCFVIAGGSGPGRRGIHVDGSEYTVNDVLTTMVQMACVTDDGGAPVTEFGLSGFGASAIGPLLG